MIAFAGAAKQVLASGGAEFGSTSELKASGVNFGLNKNLLVEAELLTGVAQEPQPEDIERAVEFASAATGVRKDFLMGMLVVESNLGKNTGKCTYGEIEKEALQDHLDGRLSNKSWHTFLERRKLLKGIAEDLGYNYEQLKVSCNPPYAGTGGAMGIGQFMPDTWLEYKERTAQVVQKKHPDHWNVTDGVVAMALKLADVPGVKEHQRSAERNAAKVYLSGNISGKYDWYANRIMYWSVHYRNLLV